MTSAELTERTRNRLAGFLVIAFVGVLPFLLFKAIPETNEQIITYMVGQLSGMATMALGFYFVSRVGQDALDEKKADNTTKAFEAITATAQAGGTTPDVILEPGETAQAADGGKP